MVRVPTYRVELATTNPHGPLKSTLFAFRFRAKTYGFYFFFSQRSEENPVDLSLPSVLVVSPRDPRHGRHSEWFIP